MLAPGLRLWGLGIGCWAPTPNPQHPRPVLKYQSLDIRPITTDNSHVFAIIKIIQSLVKALNSEGTPGQVAAGFALGAALGLTPLINVHNLLIIAAIALLNVSVPGALLGWLVMVPVGFALDPVFDAVGRFLLLDVAWLQPVWATVSDAPVLALTRLNNSVVLGSLVSWIVLALPIYAGAHLGVTRYRATIYPKIARSKAFKALQASKVYNVYRMLRP